ncbi:MAG: hypothetical protein DCC75_04375 [Proteobacteria bacterium]|nr:MAG: hypothetical protein DCC75_04375 [Pseudomonadota bacterium]
MKQLKLKPVLLRKSERGGVLVEFGMTAPVVILFLAALLDVGRTLGQISWLSQVGYQIVMTGSEAPPSSREQSMHERAQYLHQVNMAASNNPSQVLSFDADPTLDFEGARRTASVLMKGNVRLLMNTIFDFPINVRITGPITAVDRPPPGDLDTAANPSPPRNCSGNDSVGSTVECLVCNMSSTSSWTCTRA